MPRVPSAAATKWDSDKVLVIASQGAHEIVRLQLATELSPGPLAARPEPIVAAPA
jgi:hypothetical protein